MKERLDMLGGKIHVDGSDGFCVVAEIPIRWGTEND
jgi:signal transduction histidine kinase